MNLKNRIKKLENEIGKNKARIIIYAGEKPKTKDPNVLLLDWGSGILEDGEFFELSNMTHEEALELMY